MDMDEEGTLGMISSEMHFGWTSPSLPILTSGEYTFTITHETASWLAVSFLTGNILGAIISAVVSDRYGRKNILLATSIPFFVSWILIGLSEVPDILFVARFLGGIASGLSYSVVPMYLGEISEPSTRGIISSICPIFVVLGILLINILGNYLPLHVAAYVASTIPLIMFTTFIWMPESPLYLFKNQKHIESLNSLAKLRGKISGEKEFERLKLVDAAAEKEKQQQELEREQENVKQQELSTTTKSKSFKVFDVFKVKHYRKALLIAMGLRTVQQFCGSTVITFYCKELFGETENFLSPNVGTIVFFSLQAMVAIGSSYLFDIFGRRLLILVSLLGTTLSLFALAIYLYSKTISSDVDVTKYEVVPLVILLMNVVFFSFGVRNTPMVVMSEIFPTSIKSTALCLVTIYYGLLGIGTTKFFNFSKTSLGLYFSFSVFGVLSLVDFIIVYLYLPETKGKTLEEIQEVLKGES